MCVFLSAHPTAVSEDVRNGAQSGREVKTDREDDGWRQVPRVHGSSRWELDKRSPSWLDELVPSFTAA